MLCIYFYIKTWFDCCQKLTLLKTQKELERDQTVKEPNLFMFMFRVKNAFMSRFWFLFIDFYLVWIQAIVITAAETKRTQK